MPLNEDFQTVNIENQEAFNPNGGDAYFPILQTDDGGVSYDWKKATASQFESITDRKAYIYNPALTTVAAQGTSDGYMVGSSQYGYKDVYKILSGNTAVDLRFDTGTLQGYYYVEYTISNSNLTIGKFASSIRVGSDGIILYQSTKCVQLIETAESNSYYSNIDDWVSEDGECYQRIRLGGSANGAIVYARIYNTIHFTFKSLDDIGFGTPYTDGVTVTYPTQAMSEYYITVDLLADGTPGSDSESGVTSYSLADGVSILTLTDTSYKIIGCWLTPREDYTPSLYKFYLSATSSNTATVYNGGQAGGVRCSVLLKIAKA